MKSKDNISRRQFMQKTAKGLAGTAALGLVSSCNSVYRAGKTPVLPKRTLGRTGLEVSILSFGGGSQFMVNKNGQWEPLLERAVEMGINYFDTGPGYGKRSSPCSEERYGQILSKYRDKVLISTKIDSRDPDQAMRDLEVSLKRFKTDYVDVLLLHHVGGRNPKRKVEETAADLDKGIYTTLRKLKEQGVARHIGLSVMFSGEVAKEMIEVLDPDVALMTLTATKYGEVAEVALPAARERNTGVIAMKVMRWVVNKGATAKELLHYDLALDGVASAMVGHASMEILEENYRNALAYGAPGEPVVDKAELEARLSPLATPDVLQWARPDYDDEMLA